MTTPLPDLTPRQPGASPTDSASVPYPPTYAPQPAVGWASQVSMSAPGYAGPLPGASAPDAASSARSRAGLALGWAIGAAVAAGVAVVLAVIALVVSFSAGTFDDASYEPLSGQVPGLSDGATLSGDRLEYVLVNALRELGGEEVEIECPDTAAVSTSTLVVCRGDVDRYPWTGAVFFEDSEGRFVVAEF